MTSQTRICLLGSVQVLERDGTSISRFQSRRSLALLVWMALHPDTPQERDIVGEALWPDENPRTQRDRLRQTLALLRQDLDSIRIVESIGRTHLRLAADVTVDVTDFHRCLRAARRSDTRDAGTRLGYLHRALRLYTGPLAPGLEDIWIAEQRAAVESKFASAAVECARLLVSRGELTIAHDILNRAGSLAPMQEGITDCLDTLAEKAASRPHRPAPAAMLTPLFGRDRERGLLLAWLGTRQDRCVTLLGAGGIGKTRLAREAAGDLSDVFDGFIWFIPLAAIRTAEDIVPALLQALRQSGHLTGPPEDAHSPEERVIAALRAIPAALVILDNLEQVTESGVGAILTRLLERVPGLHLLCTSRQVLGIPGEVRLELGPLAEADAAQLFRARVQSANPAIASETLPVQTIAAICRRLDGVALALELAAAWAGTLTLDEIHNRLSLPLLTQPGLAVESRHRSLISCIAYSYDLLSEDRRRVWLQLSVFTGGWTLAAAEAVLNRPDTLFLLASLRERSLITADTGDRARIQTRFGMLETLREFARLQTGNTLSATEWEETRHRHLLWYASEMRAIDSAIRHEATTLLAYTRFEEEDANLRAALDYGFSGSLTDFGIAMEAMRLAALRWWQRGNERGAHLRQLQAWVRQAVARLDECEGELRASALRMVAFARWSEGDLSGAITAYEEAVRLYTDSGNRAGKAISLQRIAQVHAAQGNLAAAAPFSLSAAEVFAQIGDRENQHDVWAELAEMYLRAGDSRAAAPLLMWCLDYARSLPTGAGVAMRARTLVLLADVHRQEQCPAEAERLLREAIPIWEARGDLWRLAEARHLLGIALFDQKRFSEAETAFRAALTFYLPYRKPETAFSDKSGVGFRDKSVAMTDEARQYLAAMGLPTDGFPE